jgi:dTDP-4-dehydrorhamnose reductase
MTSIVLITGHTGFLGEYLLSACPEGTSVFGVSREGEGLRCDLTDASATRSLLRKVRPHVVIHAAAMTDVDACERQPEVAEVMNRQATANVAASLSGRAKLVYISTDHVYPDTPGPHREGAEAPMNVYSRTKLAGEAAALARPGSLALRTCFFGASRTSRRKSLSDFVERSARERQCITLFRDVLFSPLHVATTASTIFEAVDRGLTGVFNLGSRKGSSKLDFGLAVARRLGLPTDCMREGRFEVGQGRAPRPHDLRLDVSRIEGALGRAMPTLEEEIAKL